MENDVRQAPGPPRLLQAAEPLMLPGQPAEHLVEYRAAGDGPGDERVLRGGGQELHLVLLLEVPRRRSTAGHGLGHANLVLEPPAVVVLGDRFGHLPWEHRLHGLMPGAQVTVRPAGVDLVGYARQLAVHAPVCLELLDRCLLAGLHLRPAAGHPVGLAQHGSHQLVPVPQVQAQGLLRRRPLPLPSGRQGAHVRAPLAEA
mmetsp:Transcript_2681/g.8047  ORF Transcript_2681/g.8047 Transcript_2681/m.8047 type:complete len:201 (-) Transcript_2681:123-725(-)